MSSRHTRQEPLSPSIPGRGNPASGSPTPDAGIPCPLPTPCGPVSDAVVRALTAPELRPRPSPRPTHLEPVADPLTDRDFQLALWMLYELHYRGFDGVDPELEWDPLLLAARAGLERRFEQAVRELAEPTAGFAVAAPDEQPDAVADRVVAALVALTRGDDASAMATHLARHATEDQFREYLAERAVYHLHESDPQSFVLPRIGGPAKAALAELQHDEYGGGRPQRLHAALFGRALESLRMTTVLTPYVDAAEATTLASVNVMSLFALHRRLRGAALGHLAAFEATSSVPCALIARGAQRLGLPEPVVDYYLEHVEADSVHEQLAIREICGALVREQPGLAADVVLGAAACLSVDGLAGDVVLARWGAGSGAPGSLAS